MLFFAQNNRVLIGSIRNLGEKTQGKKKASWLKVY